MTVSENALAERRASLSPEQHKRSGRTNVGESERLASVIGGSALALYGLSRRSLGGVALALVGGSLVYRGASGYCAMYESLGVNTTGRGRGGTGHVGHLGIKVQKTITVNRSPEDLFSFWRDFENLPRFMNHLERVTITDQDRSHWVAKAPLGSNVEWDAEIINEKPNELIAWRSIEGSEVDNAGSVTFRPVAGGRGTEVKVSLQYNPPGGALGALVAKLFGEEPSQQIEEDLRRLRQLMESGEVASTEGQSSGRAAKSGA